MKDHTIIFNKVPPHSLEAEETILALMLTENNCILKVKDLLMEDYFYKITHQKIFSAMIAAFEKTGSVDVGILINELDQRSQREEIGGGGYIYHLMNDFASASPVEHHARIIKEKALLRKILEKSDEIIRIVFEGHEPLSVVLAEWQNSLTDLMKKALDGNQAPRLKMSLNQVLDYFANCREMPWPLLNKYLGGLFGGELIIVGGLPGVGKSTFAHAIMRHTAIEESLPVAYFGPEIASQRIYIRQLAAMCRIAENDIKRSKIKNNEQLDKLKAASQKFNAADIHEEIVGERISALDLMTHVRRFTDRAKKLMGVVIIENLQQIIWPGKKPGKETADTVLSALRAFGIEMKIPIYISCQLNEPEEGDKDRRPTLGNLRSTGNTQEIADKILLLHRPGYHPSKKIFKKSEPGEVIIAKGGPSMILPFTFCGSCFYWEEGARTQKRKK